MNNRRYWLLVSAVLLLAACASSSTSSDGWSRTYLAPRDEVIEAVIDVLEDEGYLVEADREKGRISAQPMRSRGADLASLVVRVAQKGGRVRVDVQTRTGASYSTMTSKPADAPVLEFFHELELRLRGGRT